MAASSSRTRYTREEVMTLLDEDVEDGGMVEQFFPGSDEELDVEGNDSHTEETEEEEER